MIDPSVAEGLIELVRALEGRGPTGDCCCVKGKCSSSHHGDKGATHICNRAPLDRWWRRVLLDDGQLDTVDGAA